MYCPKCAVTATPGQRFCRVCGTNLGLIVDAMEGKRIPLDFDSLKDDLRDLGLSLRVGFEEAKQGFNQKVKQTHRLMKPQTPALAPIPIKVKNVRGGSTRRYSLQQAMLSIFGGGATAGALYTVLNAAATSGLLASIERDLAARLDLTNITGVAAVAQTLWVLALIPAVKGVAHLINGIFFAVKAEPETREIVVQSPGQVSFRAVTSPPPPAEPATNEFEPGQFVEPQLSVTEDETLRLGAPKT